VEPNKYRNNIILNTFGSTFAKGGFAKHLVAGSPLEPN